MVVSQWSGTRQHLQANHPAAAALLATVATVLVRDRPRHPAARAGVAMCGGLCVQAFGGLPGVDTAFYATQFGYEKGDDNNVRALLEQWCDDGWIHPRSSQE